MEVEEKWISTKRQPRKRPLRQTYLRPRSSLSIPVLSRKSGGSIKTHQKDGRKAKGNIVAVALDDERNPQRISLSTRRQLTMKKFLSPRSAAKIPDVTIAVRTRLDKESSPGKSKLEPFKLHMDLASNLSVTPVTISASSTTSTPLQHNQPRDGTSNTRQGLRQQKRSSCTTQQRYSSRLRSPRKTINNLNSTNGARMVAADYEMTDPFDDPSNDERVACGAGDGTKGHVDPVDHADHVDPVAGMEMDTQYIRDQMEEVHKMEAWLSNFDQR